MGLVSKPNRLGSGVILLRQVEPFSVIKLDTGVGIPTPPVESTFWALTRTADELSLVCTTESTPVTGVINRQDDWVAFRVAGTMEFTLTGIVASISQPIAKAGLGIFVVSTFDTDYILIASDQVAEAVQVWRLAGIPVIEPTHQTDHLILIPQDDELTDIAHNLRENKLWAPDYPGEGEILNSLLALESGEPTGLLQIRHRATGAAIGSIGFKGERLIGNVRAAEIRYELVPSAQGQGYGTEAVGALLQIARDRGIQYLCADTQVNNAASQEILTTHKFVEASRDDRSIWWLLAL
jgi:uncharacterized protein